MDWDHPVVGGPEPIGMGGKGQDLRRRFVFHRDGQRIRGTPALPVGNGQLNDMDPSLQGDGLSKFGQTTPSAS